MSNNKRIALITTWFPPIESVATHRMLAFAEFLSEDFEVEVFCLNQKERSITWKDSIKVHYSSSNKLVERLKDKQSDGAFLHKLKVGTRIILSKVIQNPLAKWQKSTWRKLEVSHKINSFDCIISSFSPQEAHLVAIEFKKKFPTVPWIADMRDEMSANPYIDATTKQTLEKVEKQVNDVADALTTVSEPILCDFKQLLPKVQFFKEIRNGFNHQFIRNLNDNEKNSVFTLGYFGTFYGKRKPNILIQALNELKQENSNFDFIFEIFGAHRNFHIPLELQKNIHLSPNLPYLKAIEKMATFDCNVQLHPKSEQKGIFTGKLFDYISVQKPVLAFVDKTDVAAKLIEEFECGYVAEFDQLQENKKIILNAYEDWKQDKIKFASNEQVASLHRKEQVKKLAELIHKLTK
ncbi:MAG: hypothetical protein FJZ66_06180 [Bacteroidetes bacterium]|nr:hypothetical protein [Bacteroidota bacterium]